MTVSGDPPGAEAWRAWTDAAALGWAPAFGPAAAPRGATTAAGFDALSAWYRTVAEELQGALAAAPSDPAAFQRRLERFATSFFTTPTTPFTAASAFGGAFGSAGAPAAAPALGPAREHQQRSAALAAAVAQFAAAQQALVPLLAEAGRAAAADFGARVAAGGVHLSRATFDLWIECAERAWQDLAHGEPWCLAQARAFDAALAVVACQREIAAHAARLAGLPSRDEVDELHRRLRALERDR